MSKDLLLTIYNKVKDKGFLDDELIKYLDSLFSERINDVLEVIERGFSKYTFYPSKKNIWTVPTKKDNKKIYLIYPKLYCSCWDFYKRVVIEKKRQFCKHILAQTICEALDNYNIVELKDKEFYNYIEDLKLYF
ncbi:MAG: hypothetical protein ACFFBP_09785 [Promethearchaeota archaeon]